MNSLNQVIKWNEVTLQRLWQGNKTSHLEVQEGWLQNYWLSISSMGTCGMLEKTPFSNDMNEECQGILNAKTLFA